MKQIIFLTLSSFLIGCQDFNSNSSDRVKYGPVVLDESDPNFARSYNIITTKCINCHSGYHNNWASLKDNAAWLNEMVVLRGDPNNSMFIQRIINYGGTSSNMPFGGSPLSGSDYQHLVKWIEEIP